MSREQVRITDLKKYFRKYWTPNNYNNKKYLKNISLHEGVLVLKGQYIHTSKDQGYS